MAGELSKATQAVPEVRIRSRSVGAELALLEITPDGGSLLEFVITSETERIQVGKSRLCDIAFPGGQLARHQFRIDLVADDPDSTGGAMHRCVAREDRIPQTNTTVNGHPLGSTGKTLEDGDLIEVPGVRFRFRVVR
jgi:hypothetical protein